MKQTAADQMMDILIDWGVKVIFGIPGDGINGLMEALRVRADKIQFLQARHEEAAALMACGYAKYTGRLGVCLATSGPGGIHLLNGLYDAKLDGASVLAITGHHYHDLIDTHAQQDVSLDRLFMDVAAYNTRVMGPAHVENVTHLACRTALARRGVAHINFPVDFQDQPISGGSPSKRNIPSHDQGSFAARTALPDEIQIRHAADILSKGEKIVILAGQGARTAGDELVEIAELLGAPIMKALLGKSVVPDDHPLTTGSIGLLGTAGSVEAVEDCDTLFVVGSSFPYIEFLPKPGQARCVQIDIDPTRIGLRYPVDVGLAADTGKALRALIPLLERKTDRKFLESIQETMRGWWDLIETRGTRQDLPMKPQVVAWELGKRLADDAIVSSDSGTIATWWARQIKARKGQMFSLSGTLATMANGLPYTIAAQVAFPNRQCVAFVGDGGFSMLMADFATAVRYNLPIKVVIISNHTLGQIKWEQMVFLGNPEYGCDLQPIDFAKHAEACGGRGWHVEDPAEIGAALDEALAYDGPCIVDCVVDKEEPPMPGKIRLNQAKKFAEAIVRGQKDRGKIVRTVLKDKVKEMI